MSRVYVCRARGCGTLVQGRGDLCSVCVRTPAAAATVRADPPAPRCKFCDRPRLVTLEVRTYGNPTDPHATTGVSTIRTCGRHWAAAALDLDAAGR